MKLKENFTLEKLAGNYVVLPLDKSTVDITGSITININTNNTVNKIKVNITYTPINSLLLFLNP